MSSWGFDFNPFDFYLKSSLCYYKYSLNHCERIFMLLCKKKNGDLRGLCFTALRGFFVTGLTEHTVIYIFILG